MHKRFSGRSRCAVLKTFSSIYNFIYITYISIFFSCNLVFNIDYLSKCQRLLWLKSSQDRCSLRPSAEFVAAFETNAGATRQTGKDEEYCDTENHGLQQVPVITSSPLQVPLWEQICLKPESCVLHWSPHITGHVWKNPAALWHSAINCRLYKNICRPESVFNPFHFRYRNESHEGKWCGEASL